MRDKDSRLIFETWQDRAAAAGEKFGASGAPMFVEPDTAEKVKQVHGWDIQWDEGTGKWWRLDAPGGEREVTGDEHWDIMRIEDPEKAAEYKNKQRY